MPLAIATNFLGFWLVQRIPTGPFYRIAYALMFLISLALLAQGAAGSVVDLDLHAASIDCRAIPWLASGANREGRA